MVAEPISHPNFRVMATERKSADEIVWPRLRCEDRGIGLASVACVPVGQQQIQPLCQGYARIYKNKVLSRVVERAALLLHVIEEEDYIRCGEEIVVIIPSCQIDPLTWLPQC